MAKEYEAIPSPLTKEGIELAQYIRAAIDPLVEKHGPGILPIISVIHLAQAITLDTDLAQSMEDRARMLHMCFNPEYLLTMKKVDLTEEETDAKE